MQYQTPQFIEIEDKIFGPLTFKQFLYVAGAGGLCLMFLTLFPRWLAIILSLPAGGLGLALAFYEVNGRPFIVAVEHAFSYQLGSKLYLWKQREARPEPTAAAPQAAIATPGVPKLSQSKLKDLSWSLNIKDQPKYEATERPTTSFQI